MTRHGEERDPSTDIVDVTVSPENAQYWQDRRREIQDGVILALTNNQAKLQAKTSALWTPPKAGDLVLVRDFQKEKHFGRKRESNWIGLAQPIIPYPSNQPNLSLNNHSKLDH